MDDAQFVALVAEREGLPLGEVSAPTLPGKVNHTRIVRHPDQGWVLRTGDAPYDGERWCSEKARAAGIRTPRLLALGEIDGVGYCVQELIEPATHPAEDAPDVWSGLGELITTIGGLDLSGAPEQLFSRFGRNAEHAWRAHLDYNLAELTDSDPLLALGVYRADDQPWIRHRLSDSGVRELPQGLFHGDLVWQNLLRDHTSRLWLIDWGSASTGPVPGSELVHLRWAAAQSDLFPIDWLRQLEIELGQDPAVLDTLELLSSLDLVRWTLDRAPDQTQEYVGRARPVVERLRPS